MRKLTLVLVFLLAGFVLSGCGEPVRVNNGEVGVVIGDKGIIDEIHEPGSFRLEWCAPGETCQKLIRLQGEIASNEVGIDRVYLPKSEVALVGVKIGIQFRVKDNKASKMEIITKMPSIQTEHEYELLINSDQIFDRYVKLIVPEAVITALREYKVEESMSQVEAIAKATQETVNKMLAAENSPVEVTRLSFPNGIGDPPTIVLDALEKRYAITAEKAREIEALEAALEIEKHRQAVQRKRAENDLEIARYLKLPVDVYMGHKTLERFADAAEAGTPIAIGAMPFGQSYKSQSSQTE